jgi:hypothetical protein
VDFTSQQDKVLAPGHDPLPAGGQPQGVAPARRQKLQDDGARAVVLRRADEAADLHRGADLDLDLDRHAAQPGLRRVAAGRRRRWRAPGDARARRRLPVVEPVRRHGRA